MKNLIIIKNLLVLLFCLMSAKASYGQLQVNTAPQTASCNIGGQGTMTISVPTEALSGDNIPLNITLPGTFASTCVKEVTVTSSPNLLFQASGGVVFQSTGTNTYTNTAALAGSNGQNFNLFYKFPNYTTCDGAVGTFQVKVKVTCGGQEYECTASVNVKARAANYWTITKSFVSGNLVCGKSQWRINLQHNNPNGPGLGTYSISGTLTDIAPTAIVSGGVHNVNSIASPANVTYTFDVFLNNCVANGATITNQVQYQMTLGNGCGTMNGTTSATSPAMTSPNASLSFTKQVYNAYNTNLTPGCQGRYLIQLYNNGNVPWTNIVITDNLNIPGISLLGTPTVGGFTVTNSGGLYTFNGGSTVLQPGQAIYIWIPFSIDNTATVGSSIANTADVSYQAVGAGTGQSGSGSSGGACPGVVCPQVDTAVQNQQATTTFVVENPRAIPSIKKCILNPPNNLNPPLYQIGDQIDFALTILNTGSGSLSTVIADALATASQNLQIIPSSIQYEYYTNASASQIYNCQVFSGTLQPTIPFTVQANTSNLQQPTFTISGMPGICEIERGNMLRILFSAKILPQLHGSKINRADLSYNNTNHSSQVNYTVDQTGILGVTKRADQDLVENGQTFNYIIEVKNNGSVPLHSIGINDPLPGCVERAGATVVKNGSGTNVSHTTTGNIQINLPSTVALAPGETFTITIPVRKTQGGNCCNVGVTATGIMSTSGVQLTANYGSAAEPAACVTSSSCCDIPDFNAQLIKRNGKYYVQITGGAVPLQEVNVSMLDFHVSYNQADCQPANLGQIGLLSSQTTQLGGLTLQGNGPLSSLTWGLGQASVVNGQLVIEVTGPEMLDISCCEAKFTFCLKIRVKDVNCRVCEKTICYDGEPEVPPCDLKITAMTDKREFCPGETIQFSWSGTPASGAVDIYLLDATTGQAYQTLATGLTGQQSFSFTIPSNFPCDNNRVWKIMIRDHRGECNVISGIFRIICCETRCDCGAWKTHDVSIKQLLIATPNNQFEEQLSLLKKANAINLMQKIACGGTIQLALNNYAFTAPDFSCQPSGCAASYLWEIQGPNGLFLTGSGKTFAHQFVVRGNYTIKFTPVCGGNKCEPCVIRVHIPKVILTENPGTISSGVKYD